MVRSQLLFGRDFPLFSKVEPLRQSEMGLSLRVAAKLPCFLEMLPQVRSTLTGEACDFGGAIRWIGPAVMLPCFAHVGQRDLRKHAITEIETMVTILGGREY